MLEANLSQTSGIPIIGKLTQWDFGQMLKLTGLDIAGDTEVHFANEGKPTAIKMLGKYVADDASLEVEVPDISLQSPKDIYVFVYPATANEGKTIRTAKIKITARAKPEDYALPETKDYLMQLLNEVEELIAGGGGVSDAQIEAAVEKYMTANQPKSVSYEAQVLSDAQKTQARANIGAASSAEVSKLSEEIDDLVLTGGGVTNAQRNSLIAVIEAIGVFNVANGQQLIDDFKSAWEITIEATKITLDKTILSFDVAVSQTLTATVEPSGTTEKVVWHSSNESIATVVNGVVNPISNGSCTITATCGKVSASCEVTVDVETAIVTYTITNNLANVTTDNPITSIAENNGYMATLTPSAEHEFESVIVTMNGVDITDIAYSDGVVTIESVTGNVVITASAKEIEQETGEVTLLKNIAFDGTSYLDTEVIPESINYRYVIGVQAPSKEITGNRPYFMGVHMQDSTNLANSNYHPMMWYMPITKNNYNDERPASGVYMIYAGVTSQGVYMGQGQANTSNNQFYDQPLYCSFTDGSQSVWLDEELTQAPKGGSFAKISTTTQFSTNANYNADKLPILPIWLGRPNTSSKGTSYSDIDVSVYIGVKFYCFKVYDENNTLIADMKPAKQGGTIGMYCNVREKFFAGNGTLTYEELEVA